MNQQQFILFAVVVFGAVFCFLCLLGYCVLRLMKRSFRRSIVIDATPETVWSVLTDVANWPAFNPSVEKCEGFFQSGGELKIFSKAQADTTGEPSVNICPVMLVHIRELVPHERIVLTHRILLGFYGQDVTFMLIPNGSHVELVWQIEYTGLLGWMISSLMPKKHSSYDGFGLALKTLAENAGS